MAKPASIMVANWRVNTTKSLNDTLPPAVRPFLLTFSWIDTTRRFRFNRVAIAACSVLASRVLWNSRPEPASRALYTYVGITDYIYQAKRSLASLGSGTFRPRHPIRPGLARHPVTRLPRLPKAATMPKPRSKANAH